MNSWQRLFSLLVALGTVAEDLYAMEFDFQPLSSLCRVEVNLSTNFGGGTVRGTFGKIIGKINFAPERPQITNGKISLSSRSLRFNYAKVAFDSHSPDWLNSAQYPEISYHMNSLENFSWHGKELRAEAKGVLIIKGISRDITMPISVHYFRAARRKYEGKSGDLLKIEGLLALPIREFSLPSGNEIDQNVEVTVSMTGASDRVRPLLPSRLFLY